MEVTPVNHFSIKNHYYYAEKLFNVTPGNVTGIFLRGKQQVQNRIYRAPPIYAAPDLQMWGQLRYTYGGRSPGRYYLSLSVSTV